mgnify:CR=1 FL=1
MAKTKPIGVRFDDDIIPMLEADGVAKTYQGAVNYFTKEYKKKKELPTEKPAQKTEHLHSTAQPETSPIEQYNFGDEEWLSVEKYTKYPSKDKPHGRAEIYQWSLMKADADEKLKAAWEDHKKNKKQ